MKRSPSIEVCGACEGNASLSQSTCLINQIAWTKQRLLIATNQYCCHVAHMDIWLVRDAERREALCKHRRSVASGSEGLREPGWGAVGTLALLSPGLRLSSQKVILTRFAFTFCLVLLQYLSNICQHLSNIIQVWTRALYNKEVGLLCVWLEGKCWDQNLWGLSPCGSGWSGTGTEKIGS